MNAESYFQYLDCPGGLPTPPYPEAPIFMRGMMDPKTHLVKFLLYHDQLLGLEYVLNREDLCSRAACKCIYDGNIACNNFEFEYFNRYVHHWYAPSCGATCRCKQGVPLSATLSHGVANTTSDITNTTSTGMSRSNSSDTTLGSGACLAGKKAGWTTEQQGNCCPGYTFQALTPKEAYSSYGFTVNATGLNNSPSAIGICTENPSTLDISIS